MNSTGVELTRSTGLSQEGRPVGYKGAMARTRHAGEWTIEDKCESSWHYLPVEVPPGCSALRVDLSYQGQGAGLDLGCFGPAGFRGWSGGARRAFTITATRATPGYPSGELEPGTWLVVLGLHRVPAAGLPYELTAEASGTALAGPAQAAEP